MEWQDIIKELADDLVSNILSTDDTIQVLREYGKITYWYYNDTEMDNVLSNIDVSEHFKAEYKYNLCRLENISVADCINEINKY